MTLRPLSPAVLSLSLVVAAPLACNSGGGDEGSEGTSGTSANTGDDPTTSGTGTSTGTGGPAAATVVLNEVLSKAAIAGTYAERGDAVEIFNAADEIVDISGWKLSDDPNFAADKTYVFPAGTSLAPGAFLVLTELDAMGAPSALPFGISTSATETITLADADGAVADALMVNGADAAESWCRLPDGTGEWQHCEETLGAANAVAIATCGNGEIEPGETCDGAALDGQTCASLGFVGGTLGCSIWCVLDGTSCDSASLVSINEFETTEDRIEIYNSGPDAIDISGWILTDKFLGPGYDPASDLEKLEFPTPTILADGEFHVVGKGELPGQHLFGLGAEGETLTLLLPDLTMADQVSYGDGEAAISFCTLPDGPGGAWTADCKPTFGYANALP